MSPASSANPPAARRAYLVGCAQVVGAGLVFALGVLCIRAAADSDAFQYLFWRATGLIFTAVVICAVRHRTPVIDQIRGMNAFAWTAAAAGASSQVGFITAVKIATVAEVFFLLSLAPLMTALLAWRVLGERIGVAGWLAILTAFAGVVLMTAGDLGGGQQGGQWTGRLLALASAATYAIYLLCLRGARTDHLDAIRVVNGSFALVASFCAILALGLPLLPPRGDIALALLHGSVIQATATVLLAQASRTVPAVTMTLLAQGESIAAPVLTWAVFGETTTLGVVAGGVLILAAVVLQAVAGRRR